MNLPIVNCGVSVTPKTLLAVLGLEAMLLASLMSGLYRVPSLTVIIVLV